MSIKFDDNSIFAAALEKANGEEYMQALKLFCKTDGYESTVNQIGCLCALNEIFYAADLYRELKSRYFATHNCYFDVSSLQVTQSMLMFAESSKLPRSEVNGDDAKIYADPAKLAVFFDDGEERASTPDFDFAGDSYLFDSEPPQKGFYDVKSPEYLDSLRAQIELAFLDGEFSLAKKLSKNYLEIETTHAPTLEAQIALCLYYQKYAKGVTFALSLAELPADACTPAGVAGAIEILLREYKKKYAPVLEKLLRTALEFGGRMQVYDLDDYVSVSYNYLKDKELSYRFADVLYKSERKGLESLKKCACAFYNAGRKDKAKEAILDLRSYVPFDFYANALLEYINGDSGEGELDICDRLFSHYSLPQAVTMRFQYQLLDSLQDNSASIGAGELDKLSALISYGKTQMLENNMRDYYLTSSFVRTFLDNAEIADKESFINFALKQLAYMMPDQVLNEGILIKLLKTGYRQKVMTAVGDIYYYLDLSKITVTDAGFYSAFAVCALLRSVDAEKIQQAYLTLTSVLQRIPESGINESRKTAYALLCITYKNFAQSGYADSFHSDERTLYAEFLSKFN